MKKFFFFLTAILTFAVLTTSCQKAGDHDLDGKTFVYDNGYRGSMKIRLTYEFQRNGNVYNEIETGYSSPWSTDGCALYYKLDGTSLTIYHGVKGWKKEVRNTVYAAGTYYGTYLIIKGNKYELQ